MPDIIIKQLSSGWWHIRGAGPQDWAQPPQWPCDEQMLRDHAAAGASPDFIRRAMELTEEPHG